MAAEQAVVGQNVAVAHYGVVTDMASGHEIVVVADFRRSVFLTAPVDGDVFSNLVAVTDSHTARSGGIKLEVLGRATDHRAVTDFTIIPDLGAAEHLGVALDHAAVSDPGPRFNDGEASNFRTLPDFGKRIDKGRRVNFQKWGEGGGDSAKGRK